LIPYVGVIGSILTLIGIFKILGAIKRVNLQLNNLNLALWRSKFINSIIIIIIGIIFLVIGMIIIFVIDFYTGLIFVILFIVLAIISGIFEMKAWENMRIFFEQNKNLFPEILALDGIEASKNLRTAALMRVLFFLIITGIIGLIYELIGYFKMAHFRNFGLTGLQQPAAQPSFSPTSSPSAETQIKRFCPNCGTPNTGQEKFCSACGAEL
jgi:hypothetical protein